MSNFASNTEGSKTSQRSGTKNVYHISIANQNFVVLGAKTKNGAVRDLLKHLTKKSGAKVSLLSAADLLGMAKNKELELAEVVDVSEIGLADDGLAQKDRNTTHPLPGIPLPGLPDYGYGEGTALPLMR